MRKQFEQIHRMLNKCVKNKYQIKSRIVPSVNVTRGWLFAQIVLLEWKLFIYKACLKKGNGNERFK